MKKNKLVSWLFFLALFLIFLLPPTDPDLGWHLRCGQEIWQKHSLCSQNQFTVLLANYHWPNHYWLYQAVIFPVFQVFGLWGLTIFNAFLMSSAFLFFYWAIKNYLLEKIFAIAVIIFLGWGVFSFGIRSQEISFFFFSLILYLATSLRQKPVIAVFCPFIFLLWANMHGGSVILGLILLSFIFLSFIASSLNQPKKIVFLIIIYLLSALTTLANPFGPAIYQEAWRHFAGVDLSKLIAEWVPPTPFLWWLIIASTVGLVFILLSEGKLKNISSVFFILPFTFLALKARRNIPFYFLIWAYLLLTLSTMENILNSWSRKKSLQTDLPVLTIMFLLAFTLLFRLPFTIQASSSWQNYCREGQVVYPCQAIEFLKKQPASRRGNIFNRYEWGGFLIWQLPKFKIFVDGRMPAWSHPSGKSPYTIYLETLQTQPGWQETLDDYNINWILISPGTFLDLLLRPDSARFGWQEVYRDKISVVYKRKILSE